MKKIFVIVLSVLSLADSGFAQGQMNLQPQQNSQQNLKGHFFQNQKSGTLYQPNFTCWTCILGGG